jgi:DNA-binding transcriptional LysR family regulator
VLDRLTLDQLRVLIAVAEDGSFSAAARRLGRVQSAVSQSVQSLEAALGIPLFDRRGKVPLLTEAGRVLLQDARQLVSGAKLLRARAESIAEGVEPELTLAVDGAFPNAPLMASLKALSEAFACLPVTLFTEYLGGAEQRLREGAARLAIYPPLGRDATDLVSELLAVVPIVPVVAADHPLARERAPLSRATLAAHVQLVLTDRTQVTAGLSGGIVSRRIWRFADMSTRLHYLLAGFGWCNMPLHLVEDHLAGGRLMRLDIVEQRGRPLSFPLNVVHEPGRPPGRAGRWLVEDLRRRLAETGIGAPPPGESASVEPRLARESRQTKRFRLVSADRSRRTR